MQWSAGVWNAAMQGHCEWARGGFHEGRGAKSRLASRSDAHAGTDLLRHGGVHRLEPAQLLAQRALLHVCVGVCVRVAGVRARAIEKSKITLARAVGCCLIVAAVNS